MAQNLVEISCLLAGLLSTMKATMLAQEAGAHDVMIDTEAQGNNLILSIRIGEVTLIYTIEIAFVLRLSYPSLTQYPAAALLKDELMKLFSGEDAHLTEELFTSAEKELGKNFAKFLFATVTSMYSPTSNVQWYKDFFASESRNSLWHHKVSQQLLSQIKKLLSEGTYSTTGSIRLIATALHNFHLSEKDVCLGFNNYMTTGSFFVGSASENTETIYICAVSAINES